MLASPRQCEYPAEYLVSRVIGRRKHLEATGWTGLLQELCWLYQQMNSALRTSFRPVFHYFEARTLIICLRLVSGKEQAVTETILHHSLISEQIRDFLLGHGAWRPELIPALAEKLAIGAIPSTETSHGAGPLKSFELALYQRVLAEAMNQKTHRMIRSFFASIIDMRNTMLLAKNMRWQSTARPQYLAFGSINAETLDTWQAEGAIGPVAGTRTTGHALVNHPDELVLLHNRLFLGIRNTLRKNRKENDTTAQLLSYMWDLYMVACPVIPEVGR